MEIENNVFNCFNFSKKESMFAIVHSIFNYLKSGLVHLTGQSNSQKCRAKVRDGIISVTIFLWTVIIGNVTQLKGNKLAAVLRHC